MEDGKSSPFHFLCSPPLASSFGFFLNFIEFKPAFGPGIMWEFCESQNKMILTHNKEQSWQR